MWRPPLPVPSIISNMLLWKPNFSWLLSSRSFPLGCGALLEVSHLCQYELLWEKPSCLPLFSWSPPELAHHSPVPGLRYWNAFIHWCIQSLHCALVLKIVSPHTTSCAPMYLWVTRAICIRKATTVLLLNCTRSEMLQGGRVGVCYSLGSYELVSWSWGVLLHICCQSQ